jgi:hypothetical protein
MLPKLCHLDNDLEIIIIIYTVSEYEYIYCVVHMTYIPYLGTFFFSRYPSVALARNTLDAKGTQRGTKGHWTDNAGDVMVAGGGHGRARVRRALRLRD